MTSASPTSDVRSAVFVCVATKKVVVHLHAQTLWLCLCCTWVRVRALLMINCALSRCSIALKDASPRTKCVPAWGTPTAVSSRGTTITCGALHDVIMTSSRIWEGAAGRGRPQSPRPTPVEALPRRSRDAPGGCRKALGRLVGGRDLIGSNNGCCSREAARRHNHRPATTPWPAVTAAAEQQQHRARRRRVSLPPADLVHAAFGHGAAGPGSPPALAAVGGRGAVARARRRGPLGGRRPRRPAGRPHRLVDGALLLGRTRPRRRHLEPAGAD